MYGPAPLMDNGGFERRTLYDLVNATVLRACVCARAREKQNLLEVKAIFLWHSQRNLQNMCLFVCCAHVRIQERLDGFSLHSILESLKTLLFLVDSDNNNGNMTWNVKRVFVWIWMYVCVPCHEFGLWWPTSNCGFPGLIPKRPMWNLCWIILLYCLFSE